MKLFKKLRKGFTLIELVVVIAVIAILSAVSVVSYVTITNKAQNSNDETVLRQVNMAIAMRKTETEPATMSDALLALKEEGGVSDVEKLLTATYKKNSFAYDQENKEFVLIKEGEEPAQKDRYRYFKMVSDQAELTKENNAGYSCYLKGSYEGNVETKKGLDVGENADISFVVYLNDTSSPQDVVIRTNSLNTVVTATAFESGTFGSDDYKCDSIRHFGDAKEVNIIKAGQASYHEFGNVGFTQVASGKFVAETGSKTNTVVATSADAVINISGGEIEHKYATDASFGESNSKGNAELEVIAPDKVEEKKQEAIDAITPDPYADAPEDAKYALVTENGDIFYQLHGLEEAIIGIDKYTLVLLSDFEEDFLYQFHSNYTLDLNGHDVNLSSSTDGFAVVESHAIIKDSKGCGSIICCALEVMPGSSITINGGNFIFSDEENCWGGEMASYGYSGQIIVNGGTFNVDPTEYVNLENHTVTKNDNQWTVTTK